MVTKKEVAELKKRLNRKECSITRLKGVYVNSEKEIITRIDQRFLNLPEEEMFKYLDIAKELFQTKQVENKVLTLELREDAADTKMMLLGMARSELKEENMEEMLYERIINNYDEAGHYLILLFHDRYDVMKQTTDGKEVDESEEVYEHIICAICPVRLAKAGLQYEAAGNTIKPIDRDWIVQKPAAGFVYPAFEDRSANEDKAMYFCADPKKPAHELMEIVLDCKPVLTAAEHREAFEKSFLVATQSEELQEEYLGKVNAVFEDILLEEMSYQQKTPKRLNEAELFDLMKKHGIPEIYAQKIRDIYQRHYRNSEYPKVAWLYNPKMRDFERAKQHKDRYRSLLARSSRALGSSGQMDLAQEIDEYLETHR